MILNRSRLIALVALSTVPAASFAQFAGALPPPEPFKIGFYSIDEELALKHLSFLAGPECEGRGTGQPGYMVAARYVAAQFKAMGLEPIGDNGTYFQDVPYSRTSVDPAGTYLTGPSLSVKLGQGMSLSGANGDFVLEGADVVFINMKSSSDVIPDELDVDGKVVVLTVDGELMSMAGIVRISNKVAEEPPDDSSS